MMKPATLLRTALTAVVLCGATGYPRSAAAAEPTKLKVGNAYPGNDDLPIIVSRRKGFFAQEGVLVDQIALQTGDKIAVGVLSGSVDVGVYTPDWFIRAIQKGGSDLKIVMGPSCDLTFTMVAPSSIANWSDLKTKRIAVSNLKAADAFFTQRILADHGLVDHDYVLIPAGASPERAAALRSGSVVATLLTPPIDQRMLDEGGYRPLGTIRDSIKHYLWGSQVVKASWAQSHRLALVAYMKGWLRGLNWLYDPKNVDEAQALISEVVKVDTPNAARMYRIYFGPDVPRQTGKIDLEGLQEVIKILAAQGELPASTDGSTFVDSSFWKEASQGAQ